MIARLASRNVARMQNEYTQARSACRFLSSTLRSLVRAMKSGAVLNGFMIGNSVPIRNGGVQPTESRLLWYTTHLDRAVGGVPVEGSYAFSALDADGRVITEGVYWPSIPAKLVERARDFKQRLESGTGQSDFQAAVRRQQPIVREAIGEVKIVHTTGSYHG